MQMQRDIVYGAHPAARLDLVLSEGKAHSLFVYFHGGGLEAGDKADLGRMPEQLTARGIAIASANYRMYPDARFPDFCEDAARAVAWAVGEGRRLTDAERVFVGGSSAGAYLAMMLFADRHFLADCGLNAWGIDGYVFDAGQPTTHFNVLRERGLDTRLVRLDEAAPLYFVTGDFPADRPLPRLQFFTADRDMVNRLEQNRLYIRTLTHFGYPEDHIRFDLMENASHCQYTGGRGLLPPGGGVHRRVEGKGKSQKNPSPGN